MLLLQPRRPQAGFSYAEDDDEAAGDEVGSHVSSAGLWTAQVAQEWKTAYATRRILKLLRDNAAAADAEPAYRDDDSDNELIGGEAQRYRVRVHRALPRVVARFVGFTASAEANLLLGPVVGKVRAAATVCATA